jgi:hypothetical protein
MKVVILAGGFDKQGLERLWLSGAPPWKRW